MKQENLNIKLKLDELVKHYADGNLSHFAKIIGEKPQTVFAWGSRGKLQVEKIITAFPDLSAEWLLRDRGPMLLSAEQTTELTGVLIDPTELTRLRTLLAEQDKLIASQQRIISLLKRDDPQQLPIPDDVETRPYAITSLHIPESELTPASGMSALGNPASPSTPTHGASTQRTTPSDPHAPTPET